jgi:hypothetical protein
VAGARDAVQDLCARSNVAVVVRDAAGADEALLATERAPGLAEAYIDLRPGRPPRVVVVDGETRQDLERRTLPEGSTLEISIETVARVVCSAVESSLAARALAMPPAPSSHPEPLLPPLLVERDSAWEARLSAFAATENFGTGFQGGGGGALSVTHGRSGVRAGAILSAAGFASGAVETSSAMASFGLLGVRLLPMLEWRVADDVKAFAAVGAGADWTRVDAKQAPQGGTANGAGATLDVIGCGMLGARFRIVYGLSALLAVDADVDLNRHRYVIASSSGSHGLFDPARVRPIGLAGLSLSFGGPNREDASKQIEERH